MRPVSAGQGRQTTSPHLGVVVEVPEVQAAHAVHGGEHGGVHGRPRDVVDIVGVVLEGVQRLVVLRGRESRRKESREGNGKDRGKEGREKGSEPASERASDRAALPQPWGLSGCGA